MKKILLFLIIISAVGLSQTNKLNYTKQQIDSALTKAMQSRTQQQIISQIDSSLNANPKGWRTQAQAKQDAVDTTSYSFEYINNLISTLNSSLQSIYQNLSSRLDSIEQRLNIPTIPNIYPPTNLTATGGFKAISLAWTQPISPYDSLQIYWSYTLGGQYNYLTKLDSPSTSYQHTNLLNNTTYYYYILAYKGSYYSSNSQIVYAKTDTIVGEQFQIIADFENNNLLQLSSTTIDTATSILLARDSARIHGNYGLLIQDNGYNADNVYGKINFTSKDTVYVRYYIRISSLFKSLDTYNLFYLTTIENNNTILAALLMGRASTNMYHHKFQIYNGSSYVDVLSTVPKDSVLCIEIGYHKGSGSNAKVLLYINQSLVYQFTTGSQTLGANNTKIGINSFGSRVDIGSYMFIDDIVVNDSYIGEYTIGSPPGGGGGDIVEGGNAWFVNKNATGLNDGTSWQNAWTSFASINWNNIEPGDTVYISGGIDSVVYNETLNITRAGLYNVVITKGKSAGHNGKVILDGQGTLNPGIYISTTSSSTPIRKVTVSKLTVRHFTTNNVLVRHNTRQIYLDSLEVTGIRSTGINFNAWNSQGTLQNAIDSVYVRWCRIISDYQTPAQTDLIGIGFANNVFIYDNYIHQMNVTGNGHNDCIQSGFPVGNMSVARNMIINDKWTNSHGAMGNACEPGYKTIVHNNVFFSKGESTGWADYAPADRPTGQFHFYNNSVFIENPDGAGSGYPVYTGSDTVYIYNNILYVKSYYSILLLNPTKVNSNTYRIDYNIHYPTFWTTAYYIGTTGRDLSYVRSNYGFDINGTYADPQYISIDLNNFNLRLQTTSRARNTGLNLGSPYNIDILGVSRPQESAWDIGAYEYAP